MEHVVAVREAGGPFRDLFDFLERIDPRQVEQARAGEPRPRRRLRQPPPQPRPDRRRRRRADRLRPERRRRARLGAGQPVRRRAGRGRAPAPAQARRPGAGPDQLDEELAAVGFYLQRPSAGRHDRGAAPQAHDALRRRRWPRPRRARRRSAWPASCAAARSAPRPAAARSSPSSPCPIPPANTRCCSRRSRCAAAARCWSRAQAVVIKVRAKATDGEVRFFGDEAEPLDGGRSSRPRPACACTCRAAPPRSRRCAAPAGGAGRRRRGGGAGRRPWRGPRGRAEAARPLPPGRRRCAAR